MHEVLVNRLGCLSLSRKSVVRLTDRPDMTSVVYRGRKTTTTISAKLEDGFYHKLQKHFFYKKKTISLPLFVSFALSVACKNSRFSFLSNNYNNQPQKGKKHTPHKLINVHESKQIVIQLP